MQIPLECTKSMQKFPDPPFCVLVMQYYTVEKMVRQAQEYTQHHIMGDLYTYQLHACLSMYNYNVRTPECLYAGEISWCCRCNYREMVKCLTHLAPQGAQWGMHMNAIKLSNTNM